MAVVERRMRDLKGLWFPYLGAQTVSSSRGAKLIRP